jgi:hypothetical protein
VCIAIIEHGAPRKSRSIAIIGRVASRQFAVHRDDRARRG